MITLVAALALGQSPLSAADGFDAPKIASPAAQAAMARAREASFTREKESPPPAPDPELVAARARIAALEAELKEVRARLDEACRARTRLIWVTSHHAYARGTYREDGGFDVTLEGRTFPVYPTTVGPLPPLTQASPLPPRP